MTAYNDRVVAEFRANGGHVEGYGGSLVLLHSTGARSGEPRINPVMSIVEGGSWLLCASMRGAPTSPAWSFNLIARPDAVIETPHGSVDVHAIELTEDDEWDAAFARFVERSPAFAQYQRDAAPRRMPIFRLEPRG
jgi:deazaflavin-dependent oxidoreductase (nitroreductase family)